MTDRRLNILHLIKGNQLPYAIFASCLGLVIFLVFIDWTYDDPFITFRYADNLARGLGFVYNSGERILSTTTPLFALLLALLKHLWSDLPRLANLIGAISLALGGFFLLDLAYSWKTPVVGWAGLLLYPTFPLLVQTLGSEIPLYLAFCLGTFAFYARQKYLLTAIFASLAVLTRPDGMLIPILLAIDYFLRVRTPILWREILVFMCFTLSWFIFAWWYFGEPLPVTLVAKQHQGMMSTGVRFAPGFTWVARFYLLRWHYHIEAIFALLGLIFLAWRARRWALFITWPLLSFGAYSVLGVTRYFWYYAALVPGFIVLVGLGIVIVSDGLKLGSSESVTNIQHKIVSLWRSVFQDRFINFLAITLIASFFLFQFHDLWRLHLNPDPRYSIYRAVGEWLNANTLPEDQISALEVGIIGFYSQRPIVDFAGLIQPDVAEQMTEQTDYEDVAFWIFENYHPQYLVLREGIFPRLEKDYAKQFCMQIQHFSGDHYGYSRDIVIYAC